LDVLAALFRDSPANGRMFGHPISVIDHFWQPVQVDAVTFQSFRYGV
jgi:hypothetical protein